MELMEDEASRTRLTTKNPVLKYIEWKDKLGYKIIHYLILKQLFCEVDRMERQRQDLAG